MPSSSDKASDEAPSTRREKRQVRPGGQTTIPGRREVVPKVRDGWSRLYLEHSRVDREDKAIVCHDERDKVSIPCAIQSCADNGCLILWCGEEGVHFYAEGMGETRGAGALLHQARLWAHPKYHLDVVLRMYRMRFAEPVSDQLTLQQIRGKEGVRVRQAYAQASREYGVPWEGLSYKREQRDRADPINRALSAAVPTHVGVDLSATIGNRVGSCRRRLAVNRLSRTRWSR